MEARSCSMTDTARRVLLAAPAPGLDHDLRAIFGDVVKISSGDSDTSFDTSNTLRYQIYLEVPGMPSGTRHTLRYQAYLEVPVIPSGTSNTLRY